MWVLFLLLTTFTWGIYDAFFKQLEKEINYFLGLLIIAVSQFVIALPFVIYYYHSGNLHATIKGYGASAIMGILLGLGTIFFFYAFKHGAATSVAVPAYSIGVLLICVLAGIFIYKEPISLKLFSGIILGIISIYLLVTK
jgi:drug/metabolite transporter (DMT)-like permease